MHGGVWHLGIIDIGIFKGTVSEQLGFINKGRYLSFTYITYSVLITIRIYTFILLPKDFCGGDKTVDKYVPVDMNRQV